jgi:hypothetical protein
MKKILQHPKAKAIIKAMATERSQLLTNTLKAKRRLDLPEDATLLPSMFRNEKRRDGSFKSRLCARGDLEPGDSFSFYSSTADADSFKFIIARATHKGDACEQRDIKGA